MLNHLKGYPDIKEMTLKQLTLKMTMIMALVTAQRTQTLKLLSIENMQVKPGEYSFRITSLLKRASVSGAGTDTCNLLFSRNMTMIKVCVFSLLEEYIARTVKLRGLCSQLLLCHVKPNGPASKDNISRWLKQVMTAAGIDTSIFKPHSTRCAATSAAKVSDVPLDEIMATAGWRSSSVFAVFYNKPLSSDRSFVSSVLGKA